MDVNINNIDIELLERFVFAQDRRSVVDSLVSGSASHTFFASLLSEQDGFSGKYEDFMLEHEKKRTSAKYPRPPDERRKIRKLITRIDPTQDPDSAHNEPLMSDLKKILGLHASLPAPPTTEAKGAQVAMGEDNSNLDIRLDTYIDRLDLKEPEQILRQFSSYSSNPLNDKHVFQALKRHAKSTALIIHFVRMYGFPTHFNEQTIMKWADRALSVSDKEQTKAVNTVANFTRMLEDLSKGQLMKLRDTKQAKQSIPFMRALLSRIVPDFGCDIATDLPARSRYLNEVWEVVRDAPLWCNIVKHGILYHKLKLQLKLYDSVVRFEPDDVGDSHDHSHRPAKPKSRFARFVGALTHRGSGYYSSGSLSSSDFWTFMKIPRYVSSITYLSSFYDSASTIMHHRSDNGLLSGLYVSMPSSQEDSNLVEKGLHEILARVSAKSFAPFDEILPQNTLQRIQAEAKLLHGTSDSSNWVGSITNADQLTQRVDIEFAPDNPDIFDVDDEVSLSVYLKNVPTLHISVYEINTSAYYQENNQEISTDIDLDGLIPNIHFGSTYDRPSIVRSKEKFILKELSSSKRGVYIVELTGNGKSARALIRKGGLRYVARHTVAGTAIRVLDERNRPVDPSRVSLRCCGRTYASGKTGSHRSTALTKRGELILPYAPSFKPNEPLVITLISNDSKDKSSSGAFSALCQIDLHAEQYKLDAAWFVELESTIHANRHIPLLIRPRLYLASGNGIQTPAKLDILEDVKVVIDCSTRDEGVSTREYPGLRLNAKGEFCLEFSVPENARHISFRLSCRVRISATNKYQDLSHSHEMDVAGIEPQRTFASLHLKYIPYAENIELCADGSSSANSKIIPAGYRIYCLGKDGEPLGNASLDIKPFTINKTLQSLVSMLTRRTNQHGFVGLGSMKGFSGVHVAHSDPVNPSAESSYFPCVQNSNNLQFAASIQAWEDDLVQAQVPIPTCLPMYINNHAITTEQDDISYTLVQTCPKQPTCKIAEQRDSSKANTLAVCTKYASWDKERRMLVIKGLKPGFYKLTVANSTDFCFEPLVVDIMVSPSNLRQIMEARSHIPSSSSRDPSVCSDASASSRLSERLAGDMLSDAFSTDLVVHSGALMHNEPYVRQDTVQVTSVKTTSGAEGDILEVYIADTVSSTADKRQTMRGVHVHIVSTLFEPRVPSFNGVFDMGTSDDYFGGCNGESPIKTMLVKSRILHEEHRYILERRQQPARPGNTLERPSLLLHPWSLGATRTDTQTAQEGSAYGAARAQAIGSSTVRNKRLLARSGAGSPQRVSTSTSFEFIRRPAAMLVNLVPQLVSSQDATNAMGRFGVVRIPLNVLCEDTEVPRTITIAVSNGRASSVHTLSVLRSVNKFQELCLANQHVLASTTPSGPDKYRASWFKCVALSTTLDIDKHYIRQRKVSYVSPEKPLRITYASDTKIAEVSTLQHAYDLLTSLQKGALPYWQDFSFLPTWLELSESQKREKYSKYACSELHLFLYMRDKQFFDRVVLPFLRCKRAYTFIDRYLLGENLLFFVQPGPFATLNALEQCLLIRWLSTSGNVEQQQIGRQLKRPLTDYADAHPTLPQYWSKIFESAFASVDQQEPETEDDLPLHDAVAAAAVPMNQMAFRSAVPCPPPNCLPKGPSNSAPRMLMAASRLAPELASRQAVGGLPGMAVSRKRIAKKKAVSEFTQEKMLSVDFMDTEAEEDESSEEDSDDVTLRNEAKFTPMYRQQEKTNEYAEMQYYRVSPKTHESFTALIPPNEFWAEFATHCSNPNVAKTPFISKNFGVVAQNLETVNHLLCALAVLGLPFHAEDSERVVSDDGYVTLIPSTSCICFHQDMVEAESPDETTVLVGQNYFDPADEYTYVKGNQVEKFINDNNFIPGKIYGCRLVVTNVSASFKVLDVLTQIPQGSIPVADHSVTITRSYSLGAYTTQRCEYLFYFPGVGKFMHYPIHASSAEQLLAHAYPAELHVAPYEPIPRDQSSWDYISRYGKIDELEEYLRTACLDISVTPLRNIYWRLHDKSTCQRIIQVLRARNHFDRFIWSWAVQKYSDFSALRDLLNVPSKKHPNHHIDKVLSHLQPMFVSRLFCLGGEPGVDLVQDQRNGNLTTFGAMSSHTNISGDLRGSYIHLEYAPVVNARVHRLGKQRKIMNKRQSMQWQALLNVLAHKRMQDITDLDRLALVYHLTLQDRVEESLEQFLQIRCTLNGIAYTALQDFEKEYDASLRHEWCGKIRCAPQMSFDSRQTLAYDYMSAYLELFLEPSEEMYAASAEAAASLKKDISSSTNRTNHASEQKQKDSDDSHKEAEEDKSEDGNSTIQSQLADKILSGPVAALYPIAARVASCYSDYPVPKWGIKFQELRRQLLQSVRHLLPNAVTAQLGQKDSFNRSIPRDLVSRDTQLRQAEVSSPSLNLKVFSNGALQILYRSITQVTVRYYFMDVELLFSNAPFVSASEQPIGQFSYIRPNLELAVDLPTSQYAEQIQRHNLDLPPQCVGKNIMVEVADRKNVIRRVSTHYANQLDISVLEDVGIVLIRDTKTGAPLRKAYVKTYWRQGPNDLPGGKGIFYKDGYSDALGRFDFVSLTTDELDKVEKFAILVVSDTHGAAVVYAKPPHKG